MVDGQPSRVGMASGAASQLRSGLLASRWFQLLLTNTWAV